MFETPAAIERAETVTHPAHKEVNKRFTVIKSQGRDMLQC